MPKRTPMIEWHIAECEADWERLCVPFMPAANPTLRWKRFRWVWALLLVLLADARWEWRTDQGKVHPAAAQATTPIQGELPASAPQADLPIFRGLERRLETPSFVFQFRQHDAPAVIAIASQIELFYTTWRQRFNLPFTGKAKKLAIEVSAVQRPGRAFVEQNHYARFSFDPPDRLIVASPALYLVPGGMTDNDLLAQSLALPLFDDLLRQASAQHHIDAVWQPMLDGLYLWQVWDSGLPLAAWQDEIVTWLYFDSAKASAEQQVMLPQYYAELCAAHKRWLTGPTYLGIPLLCTNLDREGWRRSIWGPHEPLTHLEQFSLPNSKSMVGASFPVSHPDQTVALATLIDYAVAAYGQEHLSVLVAGLGQHKSWSTLIPSVYGVTLAEFEAGWQKHLVTAYGLSQETIAHQ